MLLYRPLPFEDECLISYLIRVAGGNGLKSPSTVISIAGGGMKNNRLAAKNIFTGKAEVKAIAKSLNLPVCVIKQLCFTHRPRSDSYIIDDIEIPAQLVRFHHPRICPGCIRDYGYARAIWNIAAITACPEHRCNLIDENSDKTTRLNWYRGDLDQFQDKEKIHLYLGRPVTQQSLKMSKKIISWKNDSSYLLHQELEMLNSSDFLTLLYWLSLWKFRSKNNEKELSSGKPSIQSWTNKELSNFFLKGWSILERWPNGYYELLDYYAKNPMSSKGSSGIMKCFRDLYTLIKKAPEAPWKKILSNEFDNYIINNWKDRIMSNTEKIYIDTENLNYQTKIQSANYLDCTLAMIDTYEDNLLISKTTTKNGSALYKTEELRILKKNLKEKLTFSETCSLLEIKRKTLKDLVEAGLIKAIITRSKNTRDYLFVKNDIEKLIKKLNRNSKKNIEFPQDYSYEKVIKNYYFTGLTLCDTISSMMNGKIKYKFINNKKQPLSIKQALPIMPERFSNKTNAYKPRELARVLNVNINAIYLWMKKGYIDFDMCQLTGNKRPVKLINKRSLKSFLKKYYTQRAAGTLYESKNTGYMTLVSGGKIDGGSVNLYKR
ncbi:TniQ family protein [uncultured Endozoicomonas sp.]|uniref:TniQ family protein n=1 Tax=uncultured Endozoicomonas sp. TaxID=432652 RepID=UPI00261E6319|nr:TniQ family protein [uncultured Endozoicomonas sp.]